MVPRVHEIKEIVVFAAKLAMVPPVVVCACVRPEGANKNTATNNPANIIFFALNFFIGDFYCGVVDDVDDGIIVGTLAQAEIISW